jgi:hypothetical protein
MSKKGSLMNKFSLSCFFSVAIILALTPGCIGNLNAVVKPTGASFVQATLAICNDSGLSDSTENYLLSNCDIISNISMPIVLNQEVKESRSDRMATRIKVEPPGIFNNHKESLKIVYEPVELEFGMRVVSVDNDSATLSVFGEVLDQDSDRLSQSDRNSFRPGVKRMLSCHHCSIHSKSLPVVVAKTDLQQKKGQLIIAVRVNNQE